MNLNHLTNFHCIGKLCPVCRYQKADRAYIGATNEWAIIFWSKVKDQIKKKYYLT
jgi:hypothetical protein|tara:strand:- start:453 stop:617 length:165 start_codon:yes stop_codon:yes gene_type:complete